MNTNGSVAAFDGTFGGQYGLINGGRGHSRGRSMANKGGMKEMVKAVKAASEAVKAAKSAVKAVRRTKRVCPKYCRRKTLRCKRYVRIKPHRRKSRK
jgi:hypothetical protein